MQCAKRISLTVDHFRKYFYSVYSSHFWVEREKPPGKNISLGHAHHFTLIPCLQASATRRNVFKPAQVWMCLSVIISTDVAHQFICMCAWFTIALCIRKVEHIEVCACDSVLQINMHECFLSVYVLIKHVQRYINTDLELCSSAETRISVKNWWMSQ